MTRNLPILYENTIAGLSDSAASAYLRGAGRNERKAFIMACRWEEHIEPILPKILTKAAEIAKAQGIIKDGDPGAPQKVYEFIRERHYRRYFPDGRD